jgi:flagellar hook-basal body complex protein FliE
MTLTFFEIITLLSFLGAILTVWIDARVRLNALEVKLKVLEDTVTQHRNSNDKDFDEFLKQLKEIAQQQLKSTENLKTEITELKIILAKNKL